MEEITEYVDITPHKSIMPKIGRAGYSLPQAIAEFLDNSIDAKLDSENLNILIEVSKEKIIIRDNGSGMDKEELTKAFSLAHSSKKEQLGEFGLGLKTACQSLGKRFNITTTKKEDKNCYKIDYDEDNWLENKEYSWSRYPINILNKKNKEEHYTEIKIENLRMKSNPPIDLLKKDIGMRFSPFIVQKNINIELNGKRIKPFVPELTDEGKKDFEITVEGNKIKGWYGLMKESSQKGFYGFNIFRRGRMITCYDKIGIPEHATVAKIVGEIHLDHVPVTHNKREFIKDAEEYLLAEEALSREFKDIVRRARRTAKDDKITENVKKEVDNWKTNIVESLKSKDLRDLLKPEKKPSKEGEEKEDLDIEKRDPWKLNTPPLNIKEKDRSKIKERNPKKIHNRKHIIIIKGKRFDFNVEYCHLGSNGPWKRWSVSTSSGIEIAINTDFSSWLSTKDTPFYVVMLIAESLAEIITKENDEYTPEKISEIKEEILRKSSELKNQFEEEVESQKEIYGEETSFLVKKKNNLN